MRILSIVLITYCFATVACGQKKSDPLTNLDFEIIENGEAKGWKKFGKGEYSLTVDNKIAHSGQNAACIEYEEGEADFKAWAYTIPAVYEGRKVKLTGYIKTEDVTEGYAGLWMRIDPSVAFDNMNDRGIKGTTDWTKYEIELTLSSDDATQIVVGGILVGKGKMWVDNLEVTIDGKPLKNVPKKVLPKAFKDREFKDGSKIDAIALNQEKIEDLKTLGLVWGFLKYYHPNVTKGDYNWDFELFRVLPQILKAKSASARDKQLLKWIKKLDKYDTTKAKKVKYKYGIKINPDLDWIENPNYTEQLTTALSNIKHAKRTSKSYYIDLHEGVGNPKFRNETRYAQMSYPDVGYRLLALYRYWNVIQYYFPYKNLIEEDWESVLAEFIPKFINAANELEYKLAVVELIGRVHDTHANIWGWDVALNKHWGLRSAPVELTFIENKAVVTDYYNKEYGTATGLKIGDVLTKINNKPVVEIIKEQLKYTPASNYPTQLRDLSRKLLRTNDPTLKIEFVQDGKLKEKEINTFGFKEIDFYKKNKTQDTCFKLLTKEIAYIDHGALQRKYLPELWKEIKNTKGLVIDIRNYPSDFPIYELSNYLMPEKTPFVLFSKGDVQKPGLFTFANLLYVGKKNKDYYKGKVIIIVNETSQSSAEFHAMAYRVHPNATVIGSTTAGADGNVSEFYLPGNIRTMISGIGVYYPDKTETQRIGIVPDIEVKPTVEGIQKHKDELLEKAIELINE